MANKKRITFELKELVIGLIDPWDAKWIARYTGRESWASAGWKAYGNIPTQYREAFIAMAKDGGHELNPLERAFLESKEKVPSMNRLRVMAGRLNREAINENVARG